MTVRDLHFVSGRPPTSSVAGSRRFLRFDVYASCHGVELEAQVTEPTIAFRAFFRRLRRRGVDETLFCRRNVDGFPFPGALRTHGSGHPIFLIVKVRKSLVDVGGDRCRESDAQNVSSFFSRSPIGSRDDAKAEEQRRKPGLVVRRLHEPTGRKLHSTAFVADATNVKRSPPTLSPQRKANFETRRKVHVARVDSHRC